MKVRKRLLLIILGLVWFLAGINVFIIGIKEYRLEYVSPMNIVFSVLVFLVFKFIIFKSMPSKHTKRILGYTEETKQIYYIMDLKTFIIMIVMMSFGITLRKIPAVPRVFIAVFYVGLGLALALTGLKFVFNYFSKK